MLFVVRPGQDPEDRHDAARPRVSFVATSRNDNHGGDLCGRMQHFVDGLDEQCRRHRLAAELIMVEWNPPADREPLERVLRWPEDGSPLGVRVVTVPREVHARLPHAAGLPLFQMIAKNVGIYRSQGTFVCATNIDVLFSDGVFRTLSRGLRPRHLYRADRHDVEPHPPLGDNYDQVQRWCAAHSVRKNERRGTWLVAENVFLPIVQSFHEYLWRSLLQVISLLYAKLRRTARRGLHRLASMRRRLLAALRSVFGSHHVAARSRRSRRHLVRWPRRISIARCKQVLHHLRMAAARLPGASVRVARRARKSLWTLLASPVGAVYAFRRLRRKLRQAWLDTHALPHLHTNGCGDFTLLSRADWGQLRGYPEWPIFSWHLDSVFLHYACASGIAMVNLPPTSPVWHLEHTKGSGFVPGFEAALFSRLDAADVPYLSSEEFAQRSVEFYRRARPGPLDLINPETWGLADIDLQETSPNIPSWASAGHMAQSALAARPAGRPTPEPEVA